MSLETQVQNLASETGRRWKVLRARAVAEQRAAARDVMTKLAFGVWLLAGNLLRASVGSRVHHQVLTIRRFQRRLTDADEAHLQTILDQAVATVLWHLVIARRDGIGLRRVEHLVARFVDDAEKDLEKLSRLAKAQRG